MAICYPFHLVHGWLLLQDSFHRCIFFCLSFSCLSHLQAPGAFQGALWMYNTSRMTQCLAWQVICSDILVFIHVQGWEGHFMTVLGTETHCGTSVAREKILNRHTDCLADFAFHRWTKMKYLRTTLTSAIQI